MSDIHTRYPDKKCDGCGRLGCVYLDGSDGCAGVRAEYLCLDCTKERGYKPWWLEEAPLPEAARYTREERHEMRRKNRQMYAGELLRQVRELICLGFHEVMQISEDEFHRNISAYSQAILELEEIPPDYEKIDSFPLFKEVQKAGNIPLVLATPFSLADIVAQAELANVRNNLEVNMRERAFSLPAEQNYLHYLLFNVSPRGMKGHFFASIEEGLGVAALHPSSLRGLRMLFMAGSQLSMYGTVAVGCLDLLNFTQPPELSWHRFDNYEFQERDEKNLEGILTCERRMMLGRVDDRLQWVNVEGPRFK